jgi:pSer/pThr/pTyr-binding forkhead associated (FHA) protein
MAGQTAAPDLRQILERLEGLERSNRELTEEVRALRSQLPATSPRPKAEGPELEEQVAVLNARVDEQAQTKVDSGQRFPIRVPVVNVGRAEYNDIVFPDDSVSTVHAKLQRREGVWIIADLDSTNDTLLHDERVSGGAPISPGARLAFGAVGVSSSRPTTPWTRPREAPPKCPGDQMPPPSPGSWGPSPR